ncbi:B12-binding domain-containing protein [Mycobacterium sp. GA-2829]|uniref:cobalamin B12-binding domain-containing protein n=1 Tax=Mycobacterium sp. GA-2829 TaxID=1772283 RepID=UPI00073FC94D|nr:cobalamin-dependent protein [Mycobacterium sp. GA-2829]KUI25302.1 twin-arginine translocation pathway signal protein [Mycobacterium sp. GA-2829]
MRDLTEPLARYEAALVADDAAAARALVDEMLTAGVDPVTVLTDVVARTQREVGTRWQRGEWTVAQEHAATAISVAATKAVSRHVRRSPVTRGPVLVACSEREWHALPAMIIDCALRADGWDSTLLGAATSPMRLNQHLQDLGPEAVAVSCSVLGALPTTRRFIEASTAAGVPIVVGGPAFGGDDVRALALGATAWAPTAQGAVEAVRNVPAVVPPAAPLPAGPAGEQALLEIEHRTLVDTMRLRWSVSAAAAPPEEASPGDLSDVVNDVLHQMLHAVGAALLTGDPRPVADTAWWTGDLMRTRGFEVATVHELGEVLGAVLSDYPLARQLVAGHFGTYL